MRLFLFQVLAHRSKQSELYRNVPRECACLQVERNDQLKLFTRLFSAAC